MSEISFKPGDIIYEAGTVSVLAYIIKSGQVSISFELNGKFLKIDAGPGDIIGDSAVVLGEPPVGQSPVYRATAIAVGNVVAQELPIEVLKHELESASPLLRGWIASFVDRTLKVVAKAVE